MSDFISDEKMTQLQPQSGQAPDFIPEGQEPAEFTSSPISIARVVNQDENQTAPDFIPDEQFKSDEDIKEDKYGSLGQQAIAGVEGLGQGLVGPLAPAAERVLGVKPEDIRAREEVNPGTHYTGELLGLVAPALVTGGASTAASSMADLAKFTQAGLLNKIAFEGGETLASRIGSAAAKGAIDNMLISGSDEASKMILQDPNQSAETAITSIGLSGVLGGGIGAGLGSVSNLWKANNSGKVNQIISDFKARIRDHIDNPDPVNSVKDELTGLYDSIKEVPVFGEKGVKGQAIEKAMPEMSDKISNQVSNTLDKLDSASEKLESDPHRSLLDSQIANYRQALNTDDPLQIFNATQQLKQQLQEWSKFNKDLTPLSERPFRNIAKGLSADIKNSLEDTGVWGDAAKIQQDINGSFSKFLPALNDFEKTFMPKVSGEKTIDPGKINTYLNQLGKPNAEIKMQKISNFLEEAKKYKDAIENAYSSLDQDSPFAPISLNNVSNTLKEKTTGSRLADAFIAKGLTEAGGKGLGAGVGGLLGSLVGHTELGAIIGGHSLGSFFSSILPSIAKSMVESPISPQGFKAATQYSSAAAKGLRLINQGTKAIFKSGIEILPSSLYPTKQSRDKLEEQINEYQQNPQKLMKQQGESHISKYMPNQSLAMDQTIGAAVSYLNSLRPSKAPQSPFDSEPVMSSTQKATYNNALDIIDQPLIVLDKIKSGTVSTSDISAIKTVYPSLYQSLKSKLTNEIIDAANNKETVPYRIRMALSAFMDQPLDSTMKPLSIMSAQPQQTQQSQNQQAPAKGSKSSPALQKMPNIYQTPGQAREQRQQRSK